MRTMTRSQERLLRLLLEVAGSSIVLQQALEELGSNRDVPPTLEELVERIVRIKHARADQKEFSFTPG
jgi:hypothetical protein